MAAKEKIEYHFDSVLTNQYGSILIVVPVGKVHCEGTENEGPVE